MNRTLKVGLWFAVAAVVGLASAGRTGASPAPPAAKMAPRAAPAR